MNYLGMDDYPVAMFAVRNGKISIKQPILDSKFSSKMKLSQIESFNF
ncbi:MAG: hypothetical protein FWB90_00210 [Fibromonadales bacterium]|nr:hypothetical protein [Fibromonadales bacterium]